MKILFLMTLLAFSSCFSFKEGFDFVKEKLTQGKQAVNAFLKADIDVCSKFCEERQICSIGCKAFEENFLEAGEKLFWEDLSERREEFNQVFECADEAVEHSYGDKVLMREIFFNCIDKY